MCYIIYSLGNTIMLQLKKKRKILWLSNIKENLQLCFIQQQNKLLQMIQLGTCAIKREGALGLSCYNFVELKLS